jgi:p-hydroxybenzoate 3-monooxygenase
MESAAEVPNTTRVAIIGAGPAGLMLGRLLENAGIDNVILEARSREYCEARIRAGVLEPGTRKALIEAGVGDRMISDGLLHGGVHLRFYGEDHYVPVDKLAGCDPLTIYGQTEIVKDLINARIESGAPLLFEADDVEVDGIEFDRPTIRFRHNGTEHTLRTEIVVGCDGGHGIARETMPSGVRKIWRREYPFAWLGIMAEIYTPHDELIYALNERGFALRSMRSRTLSRLYIQVEPDEQLENWSDDRIWEELSLRLAYEGWELPTGPIVERSISPMRSMVAMPLRYRRLFLAGDAAHTVPPTGAKGLNLAIGDVVVLARCLTDYFATHDDAALDAYSEQRISRIWRAQHFSWWMTQMLHLDPHDDDYGRELQKSQLRYVTSSEAAGRSLAENYAGLVD